MGLDNWKTQGMMIIYKFIVSLIAREKEYGLTYIALSRITKFWNLGIKDIEGILKNRLYRKIHIHSKMEKQLIKEKRLYKLE